MKCPDGWEVHDSRWIIKNEQVTHDRWLLLFYNYLNDEDMPACWLHVCKGEWRQDERHDQGFYIRQHILQQPASLLEADCIAMEWRKDILEGRTHEATP